MSKTNRFKAFLSTVFWSLAGSIAPLGAYAHLGDSFDLSWSTIDGGGGSNSSGQFAITETSGNSTQANSLASGRSGFNTDKGVTHMLDVQQ